MKCQSCAICLDNDLCTIVNKQVLMPKEMIVDFKIKLCESNPQELKRLRDLRLKTILKN